MKRPLCAFTLVFCAGIVFARFSGLSFQLYSFLSLVFFVSAVVSLKSRLIFNIALALFSFFLGAALFANSQILSSNHISKLIAKTSDYYLVQGFVKSEPIIKGSKQSFIVNAVSLQLKDFRYSCSGGVLVRSSDGQAFNYGDQLILKGKLYSPYKFGHNRFSYLASQGIFCLMNARSISAVRMPAPHRTNKIIALALKLRKKMSSIIVSCLSKCPAGILKAMVLGERSGVPQLINASMTKTGTVHILVVSGFNVGIVCLILDLSLKVLRFKRKARFLLIMPLLILYCFITGASTPVVRATIMALVILSGYLVNREPDIYNSLCIAAMAIFIYNPNQLFDIGFQLSFASVFFIVYLYPKLRKVTGIERLKHKFVRKIIEAGLVSLSAWIGTAGFIVYYFKIFSPVTVLANILIVPLATFITLCGFSLIFIHLTLPFLAHFSAVTVEFAVVLLLKTNAFLVHLPLAYLYL